MSKKASAPKNNPSKQAVKTEWDFRDLFSSPNDPKIEKETKAFEEACEEFEKKYKNETGYLANSRLLKKAMVDYEKLLMKTSTSKAAWYYSMILSVDNENHKVRSALSILENRLTQAKNRVIFFELQIGKIDQNTQKEFLSSPELTDYQYFLKKKFDTAKYYLGEAEEKILSLKSQPSYSMWVDASEKELSCRTVKWKGKELPLSKAVGMVTTLPMKERYKLREIINHKLKEFPALNEAEINAIVMNKKIDDELRGATKPYELTVVGYQNDLKTVEALVESVTKAFHISHRFYKLKAKLLKVKKLRIADTAVGIGKTDMKIPLGLTIDTVNDAFGEADLRFSQIFERLWKEGRVDAYPRKGKRGGAFCSSGYEVPTSIMLNHLDNFDSLMTLAHEAGHAIHAELSKSQGVLYQGHTISVAEVASTFFENLAFEKVFNRLSEKDKKIALFDRIQDDMSTIFRQIAFFNFENEMHLTIREKGSLTHEELAKLFSKHLRSYIGNAMDITDDDGYTYTYIPHIRSFFYVYSYAYGQLISKALYRKYTEDKGFIEKVIEFLKAGESKSPYQIFKDIGIDTSKPEFFREGLLQIEANLKRLENML